MSYRFSKLSMVFASLTLTSFSCAHHRDVRPGAKNTHMVEFPVEERGQGYRNAYSQAKHYCEERKKGEPVIVEEQTTFVGSGTEAEYKRNKTIGKLAQGIGGVGIIAGGKNERKAGTAVGLGGSVIRSVSGDGYLYQMQFRCQR